MSLTAVQDSYKGSMLVEVLTGVLLLLLFVFLVCE